MRARDLVWASLLLAGCGAAPLDRGAEAPVSPSALDAPVHAPAPQGEAQRVGASSDDELGLAEFERLLADKESQLRAAGVLVARREEAKLAEPAPDPHPDARFAQPPPPSPSDGDAVAKTKAVGGGGRATAAKRPTTTPTAAAPPGTSVGGVVGGGTAASAESRKRPARADKPTGPRPAAEAAASEDELVDNRCQTICDLADTTCDLEGKICDLATRHPSDARYGDLCKRAEDDCKQAADACQLCSP